MKVKFVILLLFSFSFFLYGENGDVVKYLPEQPSYIFYIESLKDSYKNFENSYFWKKFKLSSQGKKFEESINSISASFFVIGLTFNDLLDIFSGNTILALWISNNAITDFIYILEFNEYIKEFLKRIEYFAIANKIDFKKYNYLSSEFLSFEEKVFIAKIENYVIIGNNKFKIEKTASNIENNITNLNFKFDKRFKKSDFVFWNNYDLNTLFNFKFNNNLKIDAFQSISNFNTNIISFKQLEFIPSEVDFVATSQNLEKCNYTFLKIFESFDTNFINVDVNYFKTFIEKSKSLSFTDFFIGIDFKKSETNIIIVKKEKVTNFLNLTNIGNFYNQKIYNFNGEKLKYFTFIDDFGLYSNDLTFLKEAIESYKKKKSFYFSPVMQKIKRSIEKKSIISFSFFDLNDYIIKKSFKYPEEKWIYYNAYIKSFKEVLLYTYKDNNEAHSLLLTFGLEKK